MQAGLNKEQIPLLWINLKRSRQRRARMEWALKKGGWDAYRFCAVDANDSSNCLLPIPNLLKRGTKLPGIYRKEEMKPERITTRSELACLASWKRLLISAKQITSLSKWVLLMEDDLGASLAHPRAWAHSLQDLIDFCPDKTLAIQLSPISSRVREELDKKWQESRGTCLAVSKKYVRSHGNGAVLLHKKAIEILIDPMIYLGSKWSKNWHPLIHPWKIRPVADKWIYGALPPETCQVSTYSNFCLDADDSTLHREHIDAYHKPSRQTTLNIWKRDKRHDLLSAQKIWDSIKSG